MLLYICLLLLGIVAGFMNTLAGGGSILVLPILILAGLPSPVANATNRVAILFQNITGSYRFYKHKKLKPRPVRHIAIATIIGAISGSFFMVRISSDLFDKVMGIIFLLLLFLMIKPHKEKNRFTNNLPQWVEFIIFLAVGFYGGFIQAGIGFILLATLSLVEEFTLIEANAVKVFIVMCYTIFSVVIFSISGLIIWKYGLVLAVGNIIGAYLGVKAAIQKGDRFVRIILTIAILIACMKLFGIFKLIGL